VREKNILIVPHAGSPRGSKTATGALAVLEVSMRPILAVLLAASLPVLITPVQAGPSQHQKVAKQQPKAAEMVETAPAQKAKDSADDTLDIILLRPRVIPNPYHNPEPSMISDAWAVRA